MSVLRRPAYSQSWEEDDCLEYYGMFSLHQMFEVIGTHLTENDMEVLSFLLDETHPLTHPLDPEVWAIEDEEGEAIDERQQGALLAAWQRLNRCSGARSRDYSSGERLDANIPRVKNGVQLLLELERRGKCDEYNFTHLLQLLRVLTRHDLLQYVTLKRPRTVSPERFTYGPSVNYSEQKVDGCLNSSSTQGDNCEGGSVSNKRMKVNRGRKGRATSKRRGCKAKAARKEEQAKTKVTCEHHHFQLPPEWKCTAALLVAFMCPGVMPSLCNSLLSFWAKTVQFYLCMYLSETLKKQDVNQCSALLLILLGNVNGTVGCVQKRQLKSHCLITFLM
ncbi:DNA-binding death effector domain-containing protein 2 isoform X2 [Ambystoma mexicanum]|uniref:DNA-binding death effector domain-containing protein 2 isoform X2 n=1 Tax=Ambystoma mexicanum TaxID=8296 RepID=UPI0037E8E5B0